MLSKGFIWLAIAGFFVSFAFLGCIKVPENDDIFFVSSENELTSALNQKDTLKGLAVSVNFYNNTTPEKQGKIDILVKHIISLKLRPVFLYGQPFDRELAKRLLVDEDGSGCTPTVWAGIFPKNDGPVHMCGADDNPRDELGFRKWISSHWKKTKDSFLKDKK